MTTFGGSAYGVFAYGLDLAQQVEVVEGKAFILGIAELAAQQSYSSIHLVGTATIVGAVFDIYIGSSHLVGIASLSALGARGTSADVSMRGSALLSALATSYIRSHFRAELAIIRSTRIVADLTVSGINTVEVSYVLPRHEDWVYGD